uniref:2'-phosphotransferase n=1 Tax=Sinocyclocheilus grahami TaxID=75366 RepID=A0A672QZV9_SINGR
MDCHPRGRGRGRGGRGNRNEEVRVTMIGHFRGLLTIFTQTLISGEQVTDLNSSEGAGELGSGVRSFSLLFGVESRDVRLSKSLSYALRHGANKMGLQMNSDGFVFVEELLAHQQFRSFSLEDVERVVATNDKQRFKLCNHPEDGRLQIRANQGHSVKVSLDQTSCKDYSRKIDLKIGHGHWSIWLTQVYIYFDKCCYIMCIIQVTDLELRAVALDDPDYPREAVHGSYMKHWPSIRSQGISRMNRTHIHLAPGLPGEGGVISDGIQFFWSENGVLLTPGDAAGMLAPCYFSQAQRLKPSPCEIELH